MRRLPTAGICLAIALLLLSVTWVAGICATYPPRSPQVAFNSAALQAFLDQQGGGIQAGTDQLDAQVLSFTDISRTISVDYLQGSGLEFGVYDPNLGDAAARCPLFTAASAPPAWAACGLTGGGELFVFEIDSLYTVVRTASIPWTAGTNFGFYVTGPGGTWYSQDSRNAGAPHALTYPGTGVYFGGLFECVEPGAFDPATPGAFTGLMVAIQASACPALSSSAGRARGTDCTPTVTSTWGALKTFYR